MELRMLRYFLVVAREENMTKAAKLLHITQPTLSRQIMQLEDEFGVPLFRRSNHSITLTTEGMLLQRRAREIIELTEKTTKEMKSSEEAIAGEISIGCGETTNVEVLAELMNAFQKEYPDVYFTFHTANATDVKELLERGVLDFGMLLEPVDISRYSFITMPCKDYWTAMMRKDHPLATKKAITSADLAGQPLIISSRDIVKNMLQKWFAPYQEQMHPIAYLNLSTWNRRVFAFHRSGIGLGLHGRTKCPELIEIPLAPKIESGAALVWKKNEFVSTTIQRFRVFAQDFIPQYNKFAHVL